MYKKGNLFWKSYLKVALMSTRYIRLQIVSVGIMAVKTDAERFLFCIIVYLIACM